MTIRDTIYKQHQEGGEAYATLKGGMLPQFIQFIEENNFEKKNVLDIGCGNGKYLTYLKSLGFNVAGTDSSPTAVEMTTEALGNEGAITCADMYAMDIEPKKFDLIISIKTIHHGKKEEIKRLIDKIHAALLEKGRIFITLPCSENSNHRNSFKDKEEIAPGTFVPLSGPEKGLPHSFFIQEEIEKMFGNFREIKYILDEKGQRIITGEK